MAEIDDDYGDEEVLDLARLKREHQERAEMEKPVFKPVRPPSRADDETDDDASRYYRRRRLLRRRRRARALMLVLAALALGAIGLVILKR